jgi:hypothetical protein
MRALILGFEKLLFPAPLAADDADRYIAIDMRAELRAAVANVALGVNWTDFLGMIGHQPPPRADHLRTAFSEAIADPSGDFNLDSLRGRLAEFADQLDKLSSDPNSTSRQLRRGLWKGVKWTGSVLIAAGVVMAVGPALAPLAAAVGASGAMVAVGLPAALVSEFTLEAGKEAAVKIIEKLTDREGGREDEIPGEPAFRALDSAYAIPDQMLTGTRRAWIPRDAGEAERITTHAFIDQTSQKISQILADSKGRDWFSDKTSQAWTALEVDLADLESLTKASRPDRAAIITALGGLALSVPSAQASLRHDVTPPPTDDERAAAIEVCQTIDIELAQDIATAQQYETSHETSSTSK